jgi:para-aminobenzoate synthetase / 4-amino-4-deoxychorismate lyase
MLRKVVLREEAAGVWLVFEEPEEVLVARDLADVLPVLHRAEQRVKEEKLHAAGFVSYEAAPALDSALRTRTGGSLPLVCLGLFRRPERSSRLPAADGPSPPLPRWRFTAARQEYLSALGRIKAEIRSGNTYQVNYTVRQRADDVDDPWALFLATAADAPFAAFIDCDEFALVSASPELFFELDGARLTSRPMKGTAARGMTTMEDREQRRKLQASIKDRAENVMIADMVRNDLGRVAVPGSVAAPALYDIEKYRTVWQMTSTITASTGASVCDIFGALFPSASVTGAPKVASMKLIAELENSPREIYTGAIGYLAPGRQAKFSVAIRTARIDKSTCTGIYGVGGGIVWDSDPEDEFEECLNKAKVLASPLPAEGFCLLETMCWTNDEGFVLVSEHLERLEASAEYFDFVCDVPSIRKRLEALATGFPPTNKVRLRLLLQRDGELRVETVPLPARDHAARWRIAPAAYPVETRNPFLYHKTTERSVYDKALASAGECDDVVLWNQRGNITETTVGNLVVRLDGKLWTPPVSCGLLAGTLRRKLLHEGRICERLITLPELAKAEEIFVINSVRGWIPCDLTALHRLNLQPVDSPP